MNKQISSMSVLHLFEIYQCKFEGAGSSTAALTAALYISFNFSYSLSYLSILFQYSWVGYVYLTVELRIIIVLLGLVV
jgi:hypothetical protein